MDIKTPYLLCWSSQNCFPFNKNKKNEIQDFKRTQMAKICELFFFSVFIVLAFCVNNDLRVKRVKKNKKIRKRKCDTWPEGVNFYQSENRNLQVTGNCQKNKSGRGILGEIKDTVLL